MAQVFIDAHGFLFIFFSATLAITSIERRTLHSTVEAIATTEMTTEITYPLTLSSTSTQPH